MTDCNCLNIETFGTIENQNNDEKTIHCSNYKFSKMNHCYHKKDTMYTIIRVK